FQAEDGIRDFHVTGVQTCALPITLVLMFAAVAIGFGPVWGSSGWVLPAAGGSVVGLAVAWVGAWRRVPAVTVTALAVVAYLLFEIGRASCRERGEIWLTAGSCRA